MAAYEPSVKKWLTEYETVLSDLKINSPEQIWSGYDMGIQNVPKVELVFSEKHKPAYQMVAIEQGETSTILTFVTKLCSQW